MKVLLVNGSSHTHGTTMRALEEMIRVFEAEGVETEVIQTGSKPLADCLQCNACAKSGQCVFADDGVNEFVEKAREADGFVFATPVYYYSVSGQLKTMLDRANPLYDTDYAFTKAYLLAAAAEDEPETVDGTRTAVQGWVDCFPRCELVDTIFAGGVNDVGDIAGHPALEKAYQAGKSV